LVTQGHLKDCFPRTFSHPGTQRQLHAWSKEAQILAKLVADLDIIHLTFFLQVCRMQDLQCLRASTQISKEGLGGQTRYDKVKILQAAPERIMHKAVEVKLKLQCRT
jgi:hypothetical protein